MGVPFEKIDNAALRAQEDIATLVEYGAQSEESALRAKEHIEKLNLQTQLALTTLFLVYLKQGVSE